jgi:hypothetical protein
MLERAWLKADGGVLDEGHAPFRGAQEGLDGPVCLCDLPLSGRLRLVPAQLELGPEVGLDRLVHRAGGSEAPALFRWLPKGTPGVSARRRSTSRGAAEVAGVAGVSDAGGPPRRGHGGLMRANVGK